MKRKLKVYKQYNSNNKAVPVIILKGSYLNEFSFCPNSNIQVELEENKIIITKLEDK